MGIRKLLAVTCCLFFIFIGCDEKNVLDKSFIKFESDTENLIFSFIDNGITDVFEDIHVYKPGIAVGEKFTNYTHLQKGDFAIDEGKVIIEKKSFFHEENALYDFDFEYNSRTSFIFRIEIENDNFILKEFYALITY